MPGNYRQAKDNSIELHRAASYKSYESTLTTTTELDFATDLGTDCTGGYYLNDSPSDEQVLNFSVDGTNYGDGITVKAGESFSFDNFIVFRKLKMTHVVDTIYRIMAV